MMMTGSEGTLLLQSFVAQSMSNLDSSRVRNPSLDKRKEGWTEQWGTKENDDTDNNENDNDDTTTTTTTTTISKEQVVVTLYQFRPAWYEQLILKMADIDYQIINSPYAATEATGPLPYLRDQKVLVGHQHPGLIPASNNNKNNIVHYVITEKKNRNKDNCYLSSSIPESKKALSHLIETMIDTKLKPSLEVLRFQDYSAWMQIHRPIYQKASNNNWFQTWSLRVMSMKKYQQHQQQQFGTTTSLEQTKIVVQDVYATLETILKENNNHDDNNHDGTTTLLGTKSYTTTDALLWAHLADALGDITLVAILADYPILVKFFQTLHQQYFLLGDEKNDENPFLHPLSVIYNNKNNKKNISTTDYTHALELMQSLRPTPNLQDTLMDAKAAAQKMEEKTLNKQKNHSQTLRMGGDIMKKTDDETQSQKKWRHDHKANDELWISTVIGVTILVLIFGTK